MDQHKIMILFTYSKTCFKWPLKKKTKIGFEDQLSLNEGPREHSAILLTFIRLPYVIKISVVPIFEWLLKTGFTVCAKHKDPIL